MQTKKISSNLRKRNSAHRLMMKARQVKAAKATPAHPRQRSAKRELGSGVRHQQVKYPIFSLLGACALGAALGYFIRSRK